MQRKEVNIYDLFFGDGRPKVVGKLTEAFKRPVYQYTSQEIRNWQREKWEKESELFSKEEQINY